MTKRRTRPSWHIVIQCYVIGGLLLVIGLLIGLRLGETGRDFFQPVSWDLAKQIEAAEGYLPIVECEGDVPYVGFGSRIHLEDEEAEQKLCLALEAAETEAKRVLGVDIFNKLNRYRRSAWIELCYWGPCAEFKRAAKATIAGNYQKASEEFLDSELPNIAGERAARLARWMRTGNNG